VSVKPPSGDPTDEDPLAAVEDDRHSSDPPVRKMAWVVRQRVIAKDHMGDRGPQPGPHSRASRACVGKGAMVCVPSRFPAMSIFLDRRGNQSS
jgi:hypothetical protein